MLGKIQRFYQLFQKYGLHAFHLLLNPLLGRPIHIHEAGQRIVLNFDPATYYHLLHSIDKLKNLIAHIPDGTEGTIVDGGANHGIFSLLAARRFPERQVFAVEPYPVILPFLKRNVQGKNIRIIEKALAGENGEVTFFSAPASDQMGSLNLEMVEEFLTAGTSILQTKVEAITLPTLARQEGITKIAVLKLDVQGTEFAILEAADEVLAMTDCLLLEVILVEKTSLALLEKARQHFPYFKAINKLPYGADIIFSKKPLD